MFKEASIIAMDILASDEVKFLVFYSYIYVTLYMRAYFATIQKYDFVKIYSELEKLIQSSKISLKLSKIFSSDQINEIQTTIQSNLKNNTTCGRFAIDLTK